MGKRTVFVVSLISGFFSVTYCARTFLSLPVPFHPTSPERQTMTRDQMRDFTQEKYRKFSITLLGGQATETDKIAKYFLPFEKTSLVAGEIGSDAVKNHEADLIANYFNVCTGRARATADEALDQNNIFDVIDTWTFQSKLNFCPSHKYFVIGLVYHHHMSSNFDKGWWFELAMPIMCIKNNMGMSEIIEVCGGEGGDDPQQAPSFFSTDADQFAAQSMTAALRSGQFRCGKIDSREYRRTKWGVADLEFRLGYTYFKEPAYHLSSYVGVLAPTGNTPTGEFMFEKVVGYNGQTGFFLGTNGGIKVWAHDQNYLSFEFDTGATMFVDNLQCRSFDLYDKQWGRYIWVYPNKQKFNDNEESEVTMKAPLKPGINYFSRGVYVEHGSIRNLNLAWVYTMSDFQGELGYHFYSRDREKVCLAKTWNDEVALAALWDSNNNFIGAGESRKSRTNAVINNYTEVTNDVREFKSLEGLTTEQITNNDMYLPIKNGQIDLGSAACPSVVVHTVYGSVGYGWYDIVFPTSINLAGGYEFGNGNEVVDRWKLWFKVGVSF